MALLDLGADVKATAPDGTTSIGLAIINAHWDLATKLLDRGADANENDPRGRPLHLVAFIRRAENRGLSSFLPRKETRSDDSIALAKALLAHGARINERIAYKNPNFNPDHMAISYFAATNFQGATALYRRRARRGLRQFSSPTAPTRIPTLWGRRRSSRPQASATIGESSGTTEALETVKFLASVGLDVKATAASAPAAAGAPAAGGVVAAVAAALAARAVDGMDPARCTAVIRGRRTW